MREIRFIDRFHSRFLLAIACNYQSNKAMCRQHDIRTETHRRSSRNNIQSPAWIASSIESLEGRPPPPSDSSELGYAGNIKPLKRCVSVMRTSFFLAQKRGSRNIIQVVVSDKPPLRRRIPTVIRRRYLGFQHAEHRNIKVMCRYSESRETSAQSEKSRSEIQWCSQ